MIYEKMSRSLAVRHCVPEDNNFVSLMMNRPVKYARRFLAILNISFRMVC
jgi:hypothetical protein